MARHVVGHEHNMQHGTYCVPGAKLGAHGSSYHGHPCTGWHRSRSPEQKLEQKVNSLLKSQYSMCFVSKNSIRTNFEKNVKDTERSRNQTKNPSLQYVLNR